MKHKDGFLLTMADMHPVQLAYAPNAPDEATAAGWFAAYNAHATFSDALAEVEDDARATYDAARGGDISDEYDSVDDVPRDGIMRARVYEDGRVHLFDMDQDTWFDRFGDAPAIDGRDDAAHKMTMANICSDFGVPVFYPSANFDAGSETCLVRFRITDEEEFRANFVGPSSDAYHAEAMPLDIEDADLSAFFQPMSSDDFGGRMTSVLLSKGQTGEDHNGVYDIWAATLTVDISNPDLLIMKVADAGRQSGRDSDYAPETAADAIFEGWFGSNDTGSPVDYGIEILDWGPQPEDLEQDGPAL